jgi:hypothetical protein
VGVTPRVITGAELSKFISDVQARDFLVLDELKKEGVL